MTFESFRLDLRSGQLLRGTEAIALRPKTWSVLRYLAERPGVLVAKSELLDAIWSDVAVTATGRRSDREYPCRRCQGRSSWSR